VLDFAMEVLSSPLCNWFVGRFQVSDRLIRHRTQQRAVRRTDPTNVQYSAGLCMKTSRSAHRCTLTDVARNSSALTAPLSVRCATMTAICIELGVGNTTRY
jgi:hypothetical protein